MSIAFNEKMYVTIHEVDSKRAPDPRPIRDSGMNAAFAYKVLGIYTGSETAECYLILANHARELWFISQRHTRLHCLKDSDELHLPV